MSIRKRFWNRLVRYAALRSNQYLVPRRLATDWIRKAVLEEDKALAWEQSNSTYQAGKCAGRSEMLDKLGQEIIDLNRDMT